MTEEIRNRILAEGALVYGAQVCPHAPAGCYISYNMDYRCQHATCAKELRTFLPPWDTFLQRDNLVRDLPEASWPGDCIIHVLGGNGIDVATLEGCCGACLCRHHTEKDKLVLCLFALRRAGLMKELVSIIIGAI